MDNKMKKNAEGTLKIEEALELLNRELAGKKDEINQLISKKYLNLKEIITTYTSKEMVEKTKQTFEDAVSKGEERAKEMMTEIDKRVHTNPWLAIGIAAASGFLLGYIIEAGKHSK
ncbi:MAG: DUF883 domain-containing protein [Candidatus Jettenia sp. CY-1]|nr:DUF883 domain-containing protein [Candidatus Jettenia sp.]WKZ19518.1 MAG: DUF883 domain-containing protein [Candidatus Jettenia sp. CY-1]